MTAHSCPYCECDLLPQARPSVLDEPIPPPASSSPAARTAALRAAQEAIRSAKERGGR